MELSDMISLDSDLSLLRINDLEEDVRITKDFLFNEIKSFSTAIIDGMLDCNMVDDEFCYKVFKYNPLIFETIIKDGIKKFNQKFGFYETLNIVRSCSRTFLQAIMCYEAILQNISADINHKRDLSKKLQELQSMPLFAHLPDDQKIRVAKLSQSLSQPTN